MGPTRVTIDTNHNDTTEVHTWYEYWCWYLQVWGGHTFWSIHIHTLIAKGYYYSYRRVRQQYIASDHSGGVGHPGHFLYQNTINNVPAAVCLFMWTAQSILETVYCLPIDYGVCNWCWRLSICWLALSAQSILEIVYSCPPVGIVGTIDFGDCLIDYSI